MKDIVGYEDRYSVSIDGLVYSKKKDKYLKPWKNTYGYWIVALHKDLQQKTFQIHRLVADAFVDGDKSLTVNHKDMNKDNNNSHNLEWISRGENITHGHDNGCYDESNRIKRLGIDELVGTYVKGVEILSIHREKGRIFYDFKCIECGTDVRRRREDITSGTLKVSCISCSAKLRRR